ncbi:MAG: radical SAM protein [Chloroflexia bacterium]|nr:radical SAM protein [Chloroflexia bacterium]
MPAEFESLGWNQPAPADRRRFPPEQVFAAGLRHHHIANTAYPIRHQVTMRAYRLPREEHEAAVAAAWRDTRHLSLYVHVPFCQVRCRYCEYAVVEQEENVLEAAYFEALLREFEFYRQRLQTDSKTLVGFDIGGGTPTFASAEHIRRVVEAARSSFQFEPGAAISIETTPIIAVRQPDKIAALYDMGVRRISMGVQTTHFKLAQSLGREYEGLGMLQRAVYNIRQAGFGRFNIDLMYGFAEQSPDTWRRTVEQTIALGPEYITLYRMRYKGTRIQEQAAHVTLDAVNELKTIAQETLWAAGYAGTPGKNTFSRRPGDEGTSEYLTARVIRGAPYLGLGLAAQTMSPYTLGYNLGAASKSLKSYLRSVEAGRLPIQDLYHLPLDVAMAKMIAVSFYFGQIHREHFRRKFGVSLEEHFAPEVDFVLQNGLMEYAGPYLRLTLQGDKHFNGVVALFYAGAVKEVLLNLGREVVLPGVEVQRRAAA